MTSSDISIHGKVKERRFALPERQDQPQPFEQARSAFAAMSSAQQQTLSHWCAEALVPATLISGRSDDPDEPGEPDTGILDTTEMLVYLALDTGLEVTANELAGALLHSGRHRPLVASTRNAAPNSSLMPASTRSPPPKSSQRAATLRRFSLWKPNTRPHCVGEDEGRALGRGPHPQRERVQVVRTLLMYEDGYMEQKIEHSRIDKQEKALLALMSEPTVESAARKAGVGRATLYGWIRESEFADRYRELRREALKHATSRLQAEAEESVRVLAELRDNPKVVASTRLQAAVKILEFAYRSDTFEDLNALLDELEGLQEVAG